MKKAEWNSSLFGLFQNVNKLLLYIKLYTKIKRKIKHWGSNKIMFCFQNLG